MGSETGTAVGLAVIGLGVIGRRMLEQVGRRDDFEIVGAWDVSEAARDAAGRDFPGTRLAANAEALIADPRVRVVYIGTPPAHHRHYALLAARAGKRVFCEKPLAVDLPEGERLVDEMRAAETPNAVNFVFASAPGARALASMLESGRIGAPVAVDTRLHFARWPRDWQANAQWLRYRAEGGFVREVLSHFVYLMTDLFGGCECRDAIVDWPSDPLLCERSALSAFDCNGIRATASATAGSGGPDEVVFTVRGERGALRLEDWHRLSIDEGAGWKPVDVDFAPHPDLRIAAYQAQLDALGRFARGEPHRLPDMATALAVQRVIERVLAKG
ncbi:MAG: hypothetical protein RIS35_1122 [Pseudomonadota bacterium]